MIYGENGRGKTTLAAVLRSLGSNDPLPISERQRLGAQHPPHLVVEFAGGAAATFQNNAWSRSLTNIAVFDDHFIDENVSSGLTVSADHRQNLHGLILGAPAVALNGQLQRLVERVEQHNTELRTKAAAIPAAERGALSVDDFCGLPSREGIEEAIREVERSLAAAREKTPVQEGSFFAPLTLPQLDPDAIDAVLGQDLAGLDADAAGRVHSHLADIGKGGETWVADGVPRIGGQDDAACPFCAQNLAGSYVIKHYRAYFSAAYSTLKQSVADALSAAERAHAGGALATFERAVRVVVERRGFWSPFADMPTIEVDTAAISRDWTRAREAVTNALEEKRSSPLDSAKLSQSARAAIADYEAHRSTISTLNEALRTANIAIQAAKTAAITGDARLLAGELARLIAVRARHGATTAALCQHYLEEKAAKAVTEGLRDQARDALDLHRAAIFPAFQVSINRYLGRFNAGFRLGSVASANTRGGPTCTYSVVVNTVDVPVSATPTAGQPAFRNTLSAGDRNTLALAFFFASLEHDPAVGGKIVVIDDPMSSLDEHRALTTVQELRSLLGRVTQVVALSHSKQFLCRLWEGSDATRRIAFEVVRDGDGSAIRAWDVSQDCITEHDRRHRLLRDHLARANTDSRAAAQSIRPVLEAFCRVAFPEHFPPGTLLGPFRGVCAQRLAAGQPVLDQPNLDELHHLTEYGNRFHHDTNGAWATTAINDAELTGFVRRTLEFTSR
jgi:energy-coupling factor transporter ATP-binding protein EcfA2